MRTLATIIAGVGIVLSSIFGFKDAEGQTKINPFVQPNDTTMNWYGSGDANNDGKVDKKDIGRMDSVANKIFTDKKDRRLNDRTDVNGDGVVDSKDKKILEDYLNGTILYLPGQWNKLPTRAEREDWLKKMLAIDKTDTLAWIKDEWNCNAFTLQTYINFHGHNGFIPSKFDTTNKGRFNLPVYCVRIVNKGFPKSSIAYLHEFNWAFMGDDALNYSDGKPIEPQTDEEVKIGGWNLSKDSAEVRIRSPSDFWEDGSFKPNDFLKFAIKDSIPSLLWYDPNLQLTRDTDTPVVEEKHENVVPVDFRLEQNYPNPFNGETKIRYELEKGGIVEIDIYNILGKIVMDDLIKKYQSPGKHEIIWNGRNNSGIPVSSGVYPYRVRKDREFKDGKMMKIN